MRGQSQRRWIKLHVNGFLMGSVRWQLTPAERSVWVDLLCLAGLGVVPGTIADNDSRPYPHSFIANRLNIPQPLLTNTLDKCKEEGRIVEDDTGIHIANWNVYQSEYERQKVFRDRKKTNDDPDKYIKGEYGHVVKR
ncbi:phage replisome organizer N-terminal domain-containing protein [Candidatus Bathyarchaeota archaeon]|nr:phage replisome organizer N-terminal domain-containing protein [Candidatus Bathyarchaeota archaeon]